MAPLKPSPYARPAKAAAAALTVVVVLARCDSAPASDYTDASRRQSFLQDSYPAELDAGPVLLDGRLIARGDSLYQNETGDANCTICHGPLLRGSTEGTNLRDDRWHTGDGSYESIASIIINGVDKPDHMSMPARGGIPISDSDVESIAAYVYWIAQAEPRSGP